MEKVHGVGSFVPVRLNGFVHTTDRLALRAIARQLKSQGYDEEEGDWVRLIFPCSPFFPKP